MVQEYDKFPTLIDTFSNVNVLQRNKLCCNDWNNGFKGEHLPYYCFKPWHSMYIGVRLCTLQKEIISIV